MNPGANNNAYINSMIFHNAITALMWGQLPVLTFDDGKQMTQSVAISEFLAKRFNMMPTDAIEQARCLELVLHIQDCRSSECNKVNIVGFVINKIYFICINRRMGSILLGTGSSKARSHQKGSYGQHLPPFLGKI